MNTAGDNWSEAVPAIFAALAVVLAGWLVLCAVKKFKKWRRAAAGSAELKLLRYAAEAVKNGELREKLAGTPRSVASMDRIYLPQIQRDFPEFNWNEFRTLIEGSVAAFLRALDERNPALVRIPGLENEQLSELVKSRVRQELVFHYQKIRIHRTAIKKYERKSGTCSILAETSLEYMTDEPDDLERLSSDKRRKTSGSGSSSLHNEYYGAAEPPVRRGESHLSGLTEPPHLFCY